MAYRPIANPRRVAAEVAGAVLAPPPPLDLTVWAVENVRFGEESPFPGPYDPARFPYWRRVLDVLSPEHPAVFVDLKKSAQLGGTVVAQIFIGGVLDAAPRPMFMVHPGIPNAKLWLRDKFGSMLRSSVSRLREVFAADGDKAGKSALYQARRDRRGYIQLAGANSDAGLSMQSYPYQVQDDLSKWVADNGSGDPASQARSRSKAFLESGGKIFRISTPTETPGCRISDAYAKAQRRETYHVACPHGCGGRFPLTWDNMLATLDPKRPEEAHFTCPSCGEAIREHHRAWMMAAENGAGWVADDPTAPETHIAFHIWAAYSPLESWKNIAAAYLSAKGNPEQEKVFANDYLGEAYETAVNAPAWEALRERGEATRAIGWRRGQVPAGYPLLEIGADCQGDRVEWQAVAFGPRLTRVVVDWGIIPGDITEEATQAELSALLVRRWPGANGSQRRADKLLIDGNWLKDSVYQWVRSTKSARVVMVRGANSDEAPPYARVVWERTAGGRKVRSGKSRFYNVGVSALRSILYAQLRKDDPITMGYCAFVPDLGDEYYQELTSEVRKPIRTASGTKWRWEPVPGVDQEMHDTHLYAEVGARMDGWAHMGEAEWERRIAAADAPASPQLDLLAPRPTASAVRPPASPAPAPTPAATASVPPVPPAVAAKPPRRGGGLAARLA